MTTADPTARVDPAPDETAAGNAWPPPDEHLLRLIRDEDAVGQLVHRTGTMADLGTEGGAVRLDWVDEVARLLADPAGLAAIEDAARAMWRRGVRHVIWSGMGGSVNAVRVLIEMGFCRGDSGIAVYPLDSTDPAAMNQVLTALADAKGRSLPTDPRASDLRDLLADTHLVAVSMGITSDEPITHLTWYLGLLSAAELPAHDHVTVLTVDGSHLGQHASRLGLPVRGVCVADRTGIPGRMSAPGTLVFLLPVALHWAGSAQASGGLAAVLAEAWRRHDLAGAQLDPQRHPYIRLATTLSQATVDGSCRLLLSESEPAGALRTWIEQLLEQTLGKGGRGIVVLDDQPIADAPGTVRLTLPPLPPGPARHRLAALASVFLGWQLCAAVFAYLHRIRIVDEPAVERYKAHARRLRESPDPLAETGRWPSQIVLLGDTGYHDRISDLATTLAAAAHAADPRDRLGYLDLTVNGEPPPLVAEALRRLAGEIGNDRLGVPVKLRVAPAAYHVSEQSEMDGPPRLISIRAVARRHDTVRLGAYSDRFLVAQAVATWQAMNEVGRRCVLVVVDHLASLVDVLADLASALRAKVEDR